MSEPTLTVLIPAYNEAPTIARLLDAIVAVPSDNQVVVIDDGSTDGTAPAVEGWILRTGRAIEIVRHGVNRGKGAAIRSGLKLARGAITIVQDADLEYDPAEYPRLIGPILRNEADAVYGSRYLLPAGLPWGPNRVCVMLLNLMVRVLYGQALTDEATCYKAVRTRGLTPARPAAASGSSSAPRSRRSSAGWGYESTRCPSPMLHAPSLRARRSDGRTGSRPSPRYSDGGWRLSSLEPT